MFQRQKSVAFRLPPVEKETISSIQENRLRICIYMHNDGYDNEKNEPVRIILSAGKEMFSFTLSRDKQTRKQFLIFHSRANMPVETRPALSCSLYSLDIKNAGLAEKFAALVATGNMIMMIASENGEKELIKTVWNFLCACGINNLLKKSPSFIDDFIDALKICIQTEIKNNPEISRFHVPESKESEGKCAIM
jgi:hypothetical protein